MRAAPRMTNLSTMMLRAALFALSGLVLAGCTPRSEGPCETVGFESVPFLVCSFDPAADASAYFPDFGSSAAGPCG